MDSLLDLEALFIRQKAARKLLNAKAIESEEALLMIVAPSADVLAASLQTAREKGIHKETLRFNRYLQEQEEAPDTSGAALAFA